jgi:glycosyltransferase involved in cell wall biosynthesis
LHDLAPHSRLLSSDNYFDATRYLSQTWRYFPPYAWRMASSHWMPLPKRYDVVYASTQLIVEVYAAMILARRQQARLVAKVHHVLAAQAKRVGMFDRLFLWSERRTTRWLNSGADLIICGTPLVAADFHSLERSLGLRESPITQIGYGIDAPARPGGEERAKPYDAVLLGRIHEHKGIFELPLIWKEVVAQMPGAKLLVIGEGPHRPRMEAMFAEFGLREAVTFTGGITELKKNELLQQAKIGLSLSFEEGWGLSINEFLGAGLPVVAYDLPIYSHVFPGQLDLVRPGDRAGAALKIIGLLCDESRRREQGRRGREFVARYDYRKVAEAELQALKQLFSKGR